MQITMEALERAFAPIEEIGQGELEFEVNGTTVTLRRLLPEEESEVQKFATATMKTDEENAINAMEYIERFKLGILSYAVVQIGNLDLRNEEYVETGEVLDNGKPVRIPRVQALRKLFLKWSAVIRIAMFRKYSDLITRVGKVAESAFVFDPSDLDAEIERLEERLTKLKETSELNKASLESDIEKIVRDVAIEDERKQKVQAEMPAEPAVSLDLAPQAPEPLPVPPTPVSEPSAPVVPHPMQPRQSVIPQSARPQVQRPQHKPPMDQSQYAAGMDSPDSFVDMGDSESMDRAIQVENIRMLQQRQAAARGQELNEPPSVLTQIHSHRAPPHVAAREVSDEESEEFKHIRRTVDGVDAVQIAPAEELIIRRDPQSQEGTKVVPKGINPRFQSPRNH
jgi:hypothetical protein